MQTGRGGHQQWLKRSLSSGGSFQSESIDLLVPLEFEEAEAKDQAFYPAQTSTLDARACSLLKIQLNYIVKAEIHIAVSSENDMTSDLHGREREEAHWKFSLKALPGCALLPLKLSLIILDSDIPRKGCGPSCLLGGMEEKSRGMEEQRDGRVQLEVSWVALHIYFQASQLMVLFVQVPGCSGCSSPAELWTCT